VDVRVLLIGFGAFGTAFARTMLQMGHEVIVVERDGALVDRNADLATRAVQGDATDPAVLERAGAGNADAAVISTAESLSTTILTTVALRDLGVREIYAKVRSGPESRALEALDVSETIFPEQESGFRLAHRIVSRAVLEYTPLSPGQSLQEMAIPDDWIGHTLEELDLRRELGVQVVALRDALTGQLALPPAPDVKLKDSDSILIAGGDEVLERLGRRRR
jgi:trk system potassium uptake protein TrkA